MCGLWNVSLSLFIIFDQFYFCGFFALLSTHKPQNVGNVKNRAQNRRKHVKYLWWTIK